MRADTSRKKFSAFSDEPTCQTRHASRLHRVTDFSRTFADANVIRPDVAAFLLLPILRHLISANQKHLPGIRALPFSSVYSLFA